MLSSCEHGTVPLVPIKCGIIRQTVDGWICQQIFPSYTQHSLCVVWLTFLCPSHAVCCLCWSSGRVDCCRYPPPRAALQPDWHHRPWHHLRSRVLDRVTVSTRFAGRGHPSWVPGQPAGATSLDAYHGCSDVSGLAHDCVC